MSDLEECKIKLAKCAYALGVAQGGLFSMLEIHIFSTVERQALEKMVVFLQEKSQEIFYDNESEK